MQSDSAAPDAGKTFVVLHFRDDKIQEMMIAEPDILLRYKDYEFISTIEGFVERAVPGDSSMIRKERLLRVR